MTTSDRTADLLAALRDHHLQPPGGPASLDLALGWWNRGWVTPASFAPPIWVLTGQGLKHLDGEVVGPDLPGIPALEACASGHAAQSGSVGLGRPDPHA